MSNSGFTCTTEELWFFTTTPHDV